MGLEMEFEGVWGNWGKLREIRGNWEECYTRGEGGAPRVSGTWGR